VLVLALLVANSYFFVTHFNYLFIGEISTEELCYSVPAEVFLKRCFVA